jgi:hypothetical protein
LHRGGRRGSGLPYKTLTLQYSYICLTDLKALSFASKLIIIGLPQVADHGVTRNSPMQLLAIITSGYSTLSASAVDSVLPVASNPI